MPNTKKSNSAFMMYLHWTAGCRWISRRTFDLIPGHPRKRQLTLERLQEAGFLSCKRMAYGRRYKLTDTGYEFLRQSNPERYGDEEAYTVAGNEYDPEKIRRISLLGEAMVMMARAGYSVHPDDKPVPRRLSRLCHNKGVSPAFIASQPEQHPTASSVHVPILSLAQSLSPSLPGISPQNEFRQMEWYYYFSETDRKCGKNLYLDTGAYGKRYTPIGCYYTARELRHLMEEETMMNGGAMGDLDAFARYTKISGLLFTSGGSYRVYTTERTAPVIRRNGESNMYAIMESWCSYVYGRSLEVLYGNQQRSSVQATLLFGDKSYRAAISVIRESFRVLLSPNMVFAKRKKEHGGDTCNFNVRDMGEVIYIPVLCDALPLLAIMLYPEWEKWVRKIGMDVSIHKAKMQSMPRGLYDAVLVDKSRFACLISLNLRRVMQIVQDLDENAPTVHIFALEWQRPFFTLLTTLLSTKQAAKLEVEYGTTELLISSARKLQRHFGHEGIW